VSSICSGKPSTTHVARQHGITCLRAGLRWGRLRKIAHALQLSDVPLTLRLDCKPCKPCEMHVVGAIRRNVLKALKTEPVTFYRTQPPLRASPEANPA
jgi:hypothetical protein